VVALVLANGFFVATEFSFVAVRRTRIQQLAADGDARARTVLGRLDHLDAYIAATQLGITLASLALGWIGEPALARLIEPVLARLPGLSEAQRESVAHTVGFALAFATITVLHIVFGELAPKSLALQRPEATALRAAGPIHLFFLAFRPVIFALNAVGNAVVRALGIEPAQGHERVQSAEELMLAVDASREAGLVDPTAHGVVDRAFAFADLDVAHVMVPRTELTAVSLGAALPEVLRVAAASGFTRLPAYAGTIDRVVGVLDVRRLLPLLADLAEAAPATGFAIGDHLQEPQVIPESMPAADVFALLRDAGAQTALVVDEYGGTAGMVSREDLIRALVGGDRDGDERAAADPSHADGRPVLDGLTPLAELADRHGIDLTADGLGVDTLGGYVFARLGRTAELGDEVIAKGGHVLRVEELDGLRVARVRVTPSRPNGGEDPDAAGPLGRASGR